LQPETVELWPPNATTAARWSLRIARHGVEEGGIWLINSYIAEYPGAALFPHEPRRKRRLLMHATEIHKISIAIERKGMTLVPLEMYFNEKGRAKVKLGLAEGKNHSDKRQDAAKRDWNRQKARLMREKG
jgi:SsrA-binding protein